MQIELKKIYHRDAYRIGLFFPKNFEIQAKLKSIDASYSATFRCWYIDYTPEKFKQLKSLNLDLLLPASTTNDTLVAGLDSRETPHIASDGALLHPTPEANAEHKPTEKVAPYRQLKLLAPIGKYWVFTLQYHQTTAQRLLAIRGVYWNKNYKCYMAVQQERVRKQVHEVLGLTDFLQEPSAAPPPVDYSDMAITLLPHPADNRWMQVQLPAKFELIDKIKRFSFATYRKANGCYLLPATPANAEAIQLMFAQENIAIVTQLPSGYLKAKNVMKRKNLDLSQSKQGLLEKVPEHIRPVVEGYVNMILAKNYSASTLRTYGHAFVGFLRDQGFNHPENLTEVEVITYLANLTLKGYNSATGHTMVNALKFYFVEVAKKTGWQLSIPRPKAEKQLPSVLTKEECMLLFAQVDNQKHRLIMLLTYGAGLRVGEVVCLKWGDILVAEHKIHIKDAKGKKDRMVMLPLAIVEYLGHYRSLQLRATASDYVFEGQKIGEPYSARSLQKIMARAVQMSGIGKKATVHTLRHSFATHLLEGGTDIRYIQGFLGHSSIKTTTIYTHLTQAKVKNISSPLDTLPLPEPKKNT